MRVAVVRGGRSLERKYSMLSGHHVALALRRLGHDAVEVDVDEQLTRAVEASDIVFIALHGRDGEDGTVQLICEALGVAYTGSPPRTCQLCFDKGLAKGALAGAGIPTAAGFVLTAEAVRRMGAGAALRRAADRVGFPLVCKPAAQGSALGLAVAERAEDLSAAVMEALNYGDRVLLEQFVPGAEIAIGLAGDGLRALPPVEIRTASGVFDILARESPGAVDLLCPAPLRAEQDDAARRTALGAAAALGIRDFGRVDMRLGPDGPVVLDVKTCPGLSETSILPLAVEAAPSPFEDFVDEVLGAARARAASASV
jgi:D-alanine-D-alanine ligase